ncbi:MAG: isoleucine--tRNA ligase [Actinobacteria bacterium RBG_19FT_COMBO_36_27]|nr:MAG: isoleucine--tRNA ligase [Actinobacteria bacterium RBG_19FT_COMBO_36_27]
MFKKVDSSVELAKLEENILDFWKKRSIFEKSLEKNKTKKRFVFYEGPPTANGAPGVHHVLARVYKDIFPRYKTMKGYYVSRKAGWDTHGLPVELEVEKELNINSKIEIEKIGIGKFNQLCKQSVMRYEGEWQKLTERIGFWLDMDDAYLTFKNNYIETVWWILKSIWDKDLLYQDYKIVPYCPRCGTALSSHELALSYNEVEDHSIIVKFPHAERKNTYFLVWTTTPWTLISNVAGAVSRNSEYVEVNFRGENLILAKNLISGVFGESKEYNICGSFKGNEIISSGYRPLYDYADGNSDAFRIIGGDFVSVEEGTGIVHIAPAFGEDDMNAGRENNLPFVQMVDEEGKFKKRVKKFALMSIEEANPVIIKDLEERKLLFSIRKIKHSYPFCWRCDSRLMYYAKKSWYIKTSAIKDDLLKSNEEVKWYPEHIKYGRFGKWLENNVDWALSRERYWGTPLPVWVDDNGHKICIGSIEELKEKAADVPSDLDLHRPYVDEIIIKCPECGNDMRRVPEVIDVWFDSGSMPYAQFHYPFENTELFKESFPADFICEAIDQTRGWFYTLIAISTLLFKKSCFKNVLCLGLINDEKGQKMSKTKGNIINPWDILNKQGADALRWYFFTGVSPWLPKNFSTKAVDEVIRKFILTLWNTYSFFVIYANIDNFNPYDHNLEVKDRIEIDRWIISELNQTINKVNELMDNFNVTESGRVIQDFVDTLSNWYVRRSRRRFWKSEEDKDKISAYKTLYECLVDISRLCAPFIPFLSEEIYRNLTGSLGKGEESVHLESYPEADEGFIDEDLSFKMDTARKIVNLGRAIRSKINIKVRQPIEKVLVYFDGDIRKKEAINHFKDIILSELNVREIEFAKNIDELVSYDIKPNLSILGKKYGSLIPEIKNALFSENPIRTALKVKNNKNVSLIINRKQVDILPEEILVDIKDKEGLGVESDGEFTVGLSNIISDALLEEGFCREIVHQIQNLRKEAGFKIENTIELAIEPGIEDNILKKFKNYIMKETLSVSFSFDFKEGMYVKEIKVNDKKIRIGIKVVGSIV